MRPDSGQEGPALQPLARRGGMASWTPLAGEGGVRGGGAGRAFGDVSRPGCSLRCTRATAGDDGRPPAPTLPRKAYKEGFQGVVFLDPCRKPLVYQASD